METEVLRAHEAVIHDELELIIKSRLLIFDGYWHLEETAPGQENHTPALPVTYDYLINIHNSNHLIYPEDLKAFLELLDAGYGNASLDFSIRVINAAGGIKVLRGTGRFADARRAEPLRADWDDDAEALELKLKAFEYVEEVSSTGCWCWNLNTGVLHVSENFNRICGINEGHALAGWEPVLKTIAPEDQKKVRDCLATAEALFHPFNVQFCVPASGGEKKYLRCKGEPCESTGGTRYLLGTLQDFTAYERSAQTIKAQQAELMKNKALLQAAIQSDIVALSVFKAVRGAGGAIEDFEWVMANRLLKAVAGGRNVIGKRYTEVFPSAATNGSLTLLQQVLETGERAVGEFYYQDRNIMGWFRGVYARINDLVIFTAEDITSAKKAEQELKESKAKLEAAFNVSTTALSIVKAVRDKDGNIRDFAHEWLNHAALQMFGGNRAGSTLLTAFPHLENTDLFRLLIRAVENDIPVDLEAQHPGAQHNLQIRWKAVKLEDGLFISAEDITALTESERLKELNAKLRELDRAKTKFFSNVSHEFRTPLTLLIGPLEDVLRNSRNKIVAHDLQKLEMVHRNSLRLQKLVNTLLDFSRIEAGRLEAYYQPTDLPGFTADLASNFRSAVEKAGLKFVVRIQEADEPVYVNREMWEKIVLNLLSNAFKFTHQGKIEVLVRSKKKYVRLLVRDTGIGISSENVSKLFQRFVRIEGVKARTYEGSGIGLALVKELVALHGGSIKVKSKEGVGTEFVVSIPKGKSHLPAKQIFETIDRLPAGTLPSSYLEEVAGWLPDDTRRAVHASPASFFAKRKSKENKPTILLADDNADMRAYLSDVLSDEYNIISAENGKKVIDLIGQGFKPDLVLADVMMPEMDGHTMVSTLKSHHDHRRIPVILLSARSGEDEKIEGMQSGADDYLVKPFSSKELVSLVRARIQVARTRNAAEDELSSKNQELEQRVVERTRQLEESKQLIEKQNARLQQDLADKIKSRQNLVRLIESLRRKNYELKAMNQELTNFAFIASHDLREPLRKIQLFTHELVEREANIVTSRGKEFAGRILASVVRMNALIDDILAFSRTSSAPRSKPVEVNLNEQLQLVLGDLSEMIQEHKARIEYDNLPVLTGHPLQLSQLLQNLVANAIKFQPPGNIPHIGIKGSSVLGREIESPLAAPDTQYFRLEVSDNGIGFEEQYAEQIFHMFQRLHDKTSFPGTGMGLAICKKVMLNHKGFIVARGKPGEGSVFSCYFPVKA